MIHLRLLGPVEATVDGETAPAELLWRKHLALLAYLALAPDRRASRERLTGLLWGDKPEAAARHSLAEALRVLRRCTGDRVEDVGSGYVRLGDGAVDTDTGRFERRVEEGDVEGAADLVTGEFMEGIALPDAWELEEWLAVQRRDWRTRSSDVLVTAAERALDAGAPDRGLRLAGRARALVPTSDVACQTVMRALCLRGDRARALEAYEEFVAWLDAELGILPSEETTALAERVRQQRSWRRPAPRSGAPPRGAETRRTPLVGRGREMTTLVREWEACRDGRKARAALITGDAGTGRSRLLEELMERVRLDGGAVAVARAMPADRDSDGAVLAALAEAGLLDPDARGPGLVEALETFADRQPILLALDDAGWADERSLEELAAATRTPGPLMIAMTAARIPEREALDRLAAALGRDVPGALVTLEPLGPDALRELAAWALPDYDADALERLARRLGADTAGYPLLAVELLHAVAHGLSLHDDLAAWPAPGRTLDHTRPGDLPATLAASVRVGFRVLSHDAQRALAAAAVLDPPVPSDRIAAATDLDDAALERALDELEWERWLVADARGYAFVARIVRDLVGRDLVTPGQRQRIAGR